MPTPPIVPRLRAVLLSLALLIAGTSAAVMAPAADAAGRRAALAPGVYISGPQAIEFNTIYRYQVTVLTKRSYKQAGLVVTTPGCGHEQLINLSAGRPWRRSFPMIFTADNFRSVPAVNAALVSPATNKPPYAHTLFHVSLPLTALPDAAPSTEPPPYSYPFCDEPPGD